MFEKLLQDLQAVLKEMADMLNVKKGLQDEISRLEQENAELKEEINKHVCETPKCDHTDYEQRIAQLTEQVEAMQKEISSLEEEKANHVCPDHAEEIQALEKQVMELQQQIKDHVCPTCNHEEEIEVLKAQLASVEQEKKQQEEQHAQQLNSLQKEVDELKKLLMTN
jgi:chromosome segregation ATPase